MTSALKRHVPVSLVALCLACFGLGGCQDGITEPGTLSIADLTGSWQGTSFSSTSMADSTEVFDLIGNGGAIYFSIQAQGTFSGIIELPGALVGFPDLPAVTFPLGGLIELIDENILIIDFIPDVPPIFFRLNAVLTYEEDRMHLVDTSAGLDFNQDDVLEPAILRATLERN